MGNTITIIVVVDEISLIKRPDCERLDKEKNAKFNAPSFSNFCNLQMIFAGEFCQLKPPDKFLKSFYLYTDYCVWYKGVNTLWN